MLVFLLLLLSQLPLVAQPRHLYSSVPGGYELFVTARGTYIITKHTTLQNAYLRSDDQTFISDLPAVAYRGQIDVLTDSLILVDKKFVLDLSAKVVIDTIEMPNSGKQVSVSADRKMVAQLSDSGDVLVWRIDDREGLYEQRHLDYNRVTLSPDGEYLILSDDPVSASPPRSWRMPLMIKKMSDTTWSRTLTDQDVLAAISSDGTKAYTTTRGGKINEWDLTTTSIIRTSFEFFSTAIGSASAGMITLDVTENFLVIAAHKTALCNVTTLGLSQSYDGSVVKIARSDQRALLASANGQIRILDLSKGKLSDTLNVAPLSRMSLRNLDCSDDLDRLYCVGGARINLYDVRSRTVSWTIFPVGVSPTFQPMSSVNQFLTPSEYVVCNATTGEPAYGVREMFGLNTNTERVYYDDDTHRFWGLDRYQTVRFLDPTDTTIVSFLVSSNKVELAGRGEVLIDWRSPNGITAYSTRNGSIMWSGAKGYNAPMNASGYVSDESIFVFLENGNGVFLDSFTGVARSSTSLGSLQQLITAWLDKETGDLILLQGDRNTKYGKTALLVNNVSGEIYDTLHHVERVSSIGQFMLFVEDSASGTWFYDLRTRRKLHALPEYPFVRTIVGLSDRVLVVEYLENRLDFIDIGSWQVLYTISDLKTLDPGMKYIMNVHYYEKENLLLLLNDVEMHAYDLKGLVPTSVTVPRTEVGVSTITVYLMPNPAPSTTTAVVTFSNAEDQLLQLVDAAGRVYRTLYGNGSLDSQSFVINVDDLPHGVLFVRASDCSQTITSTLTH